MTITGTELLINAGVCFECFGSEHLWYFEEAPVNDAITRAIVCTNPLACEGETRWGINVALGEYLIRPSKYDPVACMVCHDMMPREHEHIVKEDPE